MKTRFVLIAVLVACAAWSQSAADLLQKGIYTQETVGDLDGAIKIYRQVVTSSSESRAYAAQAQYRLGQCLLKKGAAAEATQAFKTLVSDYPEQTELVAKAKAYLPAAFELLPAPWADGELLEYDLTAQNSIKAGKLIYSTAAGPLKACSRW
ncbi:MAG: tetratricopeptide repeat protein [Acidobacteria bacterium]|nr:tetratricopeptide repeat protein [Acidobacteriota bacterium]